jgi:hypothetical protein
VHWSHLRAERARSETSVEQARLAEPR